ncbi:hypothetical protein ACS0TY_034641 [Phlomoides rotata]
MCLENIHDFGHSEEQPPTISVDCRISEHSPQSVPWHQVSRRSRNYQTGLWREGPSTKKNNHAEKRKATGPSTKKIRHLPHLSEGRPPTALIHQLACMIDGGNLSSSPIKGRLKAQKKDHRKLENLHIFLLLLLHCIIGKRIKAVLGIAEGIQDYGITCCG